MPHELRQRAGVARALAADPSVLLMDEPFSAVDPVVREQLQDEFLRLQGELGKTIVMVTHDPSAAAYADRVVLLADGRLAGDLDHPDRDGVRWLALDATYITGEVIRLDGALRMPPK